MNSGVLLAVFYKLGLLRVKQTQYKWLSSRVTISHIMFSFHKPKVYRSSTGCCICKAKSSSSRFTDSKKYEEDFLECFQLSSRRQGEICNACVLLVKRWKKLPDGPKRNWRHVVDARAGPGMKSMTKFKSKQKKQLLLMEHSENKRRLDNRRDRDEFEREFSPTLSDKSDDMDMDYATLMTGGESPLQNVGPNGPNGPNNDVELINGGSGGSSPRLSNHSPTGSDCEDNNGNTVVVGSRRRKQATKAVLSRRQQKQQIRSDQSLNVFGFVDSDYWTKESICCGVVFRGQNGEVLVDVGRGCRLKPCSTSLQQRAQTLTQNQHNLTAATTINVVQTTTDQTASTEAQMPNHSNGDNSSDSGYDDSLTIGNTLATSVTHKPIIGLADKDSTVLQLSAVRRKPIAAGNAVANVISVMLNPIVD